MACSFLIYVKVFLSDEVEFKTSLSDQLIERISPISSEIDKLLDSPDYLDKILLSGGEKANAISEKKVKELKKIIGF